MPAMPPSPQPLVSILVAYYNNLAHIEETIQSALNQTYKNIELIVVDDFSPDPAAQALIQNLHAKYGFVLISKVVNEGASKAIATGFERSRGDYISVLSHDDLYAPNKIEVGVNAVLAGQLDAVFCNGANFTTDVTLAEPINSRAVVEAFNSKGREGVAELIGSGDEYGSLLTQGALYTRKVMSELAWLRDKFILDDWPFTILVWRNYKTAYLDQVVYYYRFHADNIHKHYWKWLPARVQTIAELVDREQKVDVLAYILNSMASASKQNSRFEDAYRFNLAALALASSENNQNAALRQLRQVSGHLSADTKAKINANVGGALNRETLVFKLYTLTIKLLLVFVPLKSTRKSLRKKFGIL